MGLTGASIFATNVYIAVYLVKVRRESGDVKDERHTLARWQTGSSLPPRSTLWFSLYVGSILFGGVVGAAILFFALP